MSRLYNKLSQLLAASDSSAAAAVALDETNVVDGEKEEDHEINQTTWTDRTRIGSLGGCLATGMA